MMTQKTDEALDRLLKHKVVAGRINDIEDVLSDAHIAAREAIRTVVDEQLGPMRMPAPVPKLSDSPGSIRWSGQNPGASNDEVFGKWLGLSRDDIDALQRANII
jgi:succinyl-CoA--D-citramalate CoA-transferase